MGGYATHCGTRDGQAIGDTAWLEADFWASRVLSFQIVGKKTLQRFFRVGKMLESKFIHKHKSMLIIAGLAVALKMRMCTCICVLGFSDITNLPQSKQ